jgi:TRAP-type C4-dicarboxylate transport system permease large subunit
MLIPPSILFIIFGVIANVSIGDRYVGDTPGIVLGRVLHHYLAFRYRAEFVFVDPKTVRGAYEGPFEGAPGWYIAWKFMPICILIGIVLGGIYGGFFTPIEAGGTGALAAFLIALLRRELTPKIFWQVRWKQGVTAAICLRWQRRCIRRC